MRATRLRYRLPIQVWEEGNRERLIDLLRDKFEVFLNHEDSDFPFECLNDGDLTINRENRIELDAIELREDRKSVSLTVAVSYELKQPNQPIKGGDTRIGAKNIRFVIFRDTRIIDAYV